MTIAEIISEVKNRRDIGDSITDGEILSYINDLEGLLTRTIIPEYSVAEATYLSGTPTSSYYEWDESLGITKKDIISVYVDRKKIFPTPKNSGAAFLGYMILDWLHKIRIDGALLGDDPTTADVTFLYRSPLTAYSLASAETDIPNADKAYHDMYVFYALAQIAAKLEDNVEYSNYLSSYNSLYLEYYNYVYRNKMTSPGVVTNVAKS